MSMQSDFRRLMSEEKDLKDLEIEEMSVTGGGEAYLPGLDVPEKKYKYGYTQEVSEEVHDGYKKVKGFRAGHTKDKGGFQYKDLWNLNEDQFKEIISRQDKDKVERLLSLVRDKAPELYKKFLVWMSEPYPHDYDEFASAAGITEREEFQKNELKAGDKVVYNNQIWVIEKILDNGLYRLRHEQGSWKVNVLPNHEVVPVNEREQTKLDDFKIGDKVTIDQSVNDSWKNDGFGQIVSFEGDLVTVNVTSGGGSTFARQMTFPKDKLSLQSGEIKKKEKKEKKKEKEMEKEPIKEGIKTEIRVRNKAQQFKEAAKLANKKLKEVNNILEFASQIKTDLNEGEYGASTKIMENMKKSIAEAYKKMKNL